MLFIFDMGGVVAGNVTTLPGMMDRLGLQTMEFLECCGVSAGVAAPSVFDHGLLADIQAGKIGSPGFWESFRANAARLLGAGAALDRVEAVTRSENLWETCFHPELIPGTVALISDLKAKGHRVVCGTNTLDVHYWTHRSRGDYDGFDAVYASHQMGVIKPQGGFWAQILAVEGVEASEAVFIDDHPSNVEGARGQGIKSFLFTGPETLGDQLLALY